jgi:hypothetical protein
MNPPKILKINLDLFKFNGTKRSLKKKEPRIKPIQDKSQSLKSNKLKKELLKKVKDYQKNKETQVIKDEKNKEKNEAMPNSNLFDSKDFENNDFEREFNKSLTFLHDLSKKNKDKNKKKTLKLANSDINIDIPKDSLIYNSKQEPSYGCLKNGSKPTFRDLNKTQKHVSHNNQTANNARRLQLALENNIHYEHSEFHNKYQTNNNIPTETNNIPTETNKPNIELKVLEKTSQETSQEKSQETSSSANHSNNKPPSKVNNEIITASYDYTNNYPNKKEEVLNEEFLTKEFLTKEVLTNEEEGILSKDEEGIKEDTKEDTSKDDSYIPKLRRITRTYKYKLGKKKDNKHIGLLIKNRDTQKKIKQEVAQLKQQSIQDVKNFLREKNLIKLGSQAPNDVLRKLYEDSVLAGEITNTNNENLVHNYLNDV